MCPPKCHASTLANLGIILQSKECAIRNRDHTIKLNALTNRNIRMLIIYTRRTLIKQYPNHVVHTYMEPFWKFVKAQK